MPMTNQINTAWEQALLARIAPQLPLKANVSRKRMYGIPSPALAAQVALHMTVQAPAAFDAVQVVMLEALGGASATTLKVAVAPSAKFNNGYQPVDAASAAVAWTPVTFGTTDPDNPRANGAVASATVNNATASIEGYAFSDIMPVRSLDRADLPANPPLLMLRVWSSANPTPAFCYSANALDAAASPFKAIEPEWWSGVAYSASDVTTNNATAFANDGHFPAVEVIFYHRGARVYTLAVAGDSLDQGWANTGGGAVDYPAALIGSWSRRFVNLLRGAGIPANHVDLAQSGNKSPVFHDRAMNLLLNTKGKGVTHLFFKAWSINEQADPVSSAYDGVRRSQILIDLCRKYGVIPVPVYNWAGNVTTTHVVNVVWPFLDNLAKAGIPVFDARAIVSADGNPLTAITAPAFATHTAGGAVIVDAHLNDAGQQAVGQYAFQQRATFGIV